MGCGRSTISSPSPHDDVEDKPIRIEVMFGANARSPGKTCPAGSSGSGSSMAGATGGRTMKEYEDQLSALKKENFNLKLRIYFLEERMGITSPDEDAIKKNIELKVEVESLRKELVEKQELLSQAAKAFELIEEQKQTSSRNQTQYEQSLEAERQKIAKLEKELEEYREKFANVSVFYKEDLDITPEQALEDQEKLRQTEELVSSLELELKQISASLEEERTWAQELESERDLLRERMEAEIQQREDLVAENVRNVEELRERVKDLEEQVFKRDSIVQQHKSELAEKDRIIKEKNALLEEKCRLYKDACAVSEKRRKQIDQLRASIKTRDDAFTDLNNKHRMLLCQFENTKRSPTSSPTVLNSSEHPLSPKMGQRTSSMENAQNGNVSSDWQSNKGKLTSIKSPPVRLTYTEIMDGRNSVTAKELEEKDLEIKKQEEARKQLTLNLCNAQKHKEMTDRKLKKLEAEYEKAIRTIQGFMERQQEMEGKNVRQSRKITELEHELNRLRGCDVSTEEKSAHDVCRRQFNDEITDDPERDHGNQQRFEEMESKINDLRDQIETIKAEKTCLEKRIQVESEELQEQLLDREQRIEILEIEKHTMREELQDRIAEIDKLKEDTSMTDSLDATQENLRGELKRRDIEIEEKNRMIEQLAKELQVKTQNLQKLVNTELWSKNKEIAKLHNHMTASQIHDKNRNKPDVVQDVSKNQLKSLVRELNDIGVKVTFTDEVVQLNYINGNDQIDVKTMTTYVQKLVAQKNDLEKEVDYLKWLKLVSKPDISGEIDGCGNEAERAKRYCELLRTHLKDLVKFMKEMLKNADHADIIGNEHKKIVLDVLVSSKILSDDFVQALEKMSVSDMPFSMQNAILYNEKIDSVRKSRSDNVLDVAKNQTSTQSDSEAFSEPDRTVSMARIGLQEAQHRGLSRPRFVKYTKTSDSEDSIDYVPYHKSYQTDLLDLDTGYQMQELKETNNLLYSELSALRNDLSTKINLNNVFDEKLEPLMAQLDKSQKFCEKLQSLLERRPHECHAFKKETKLNNIRKTQLEKKIADVESMTMEAVTKQRTELLQYKENAERKTAEMLISLNRENDMLRLRIKNLEEENATAKEKISSLTKELDHLTLSHSQILVENTKLTNDKLRLEQELRKSENRYDVKVRSIHDKFNKEISDLNQINDSHRIRMQELEAANKELRRHVTVCEASDSAPSSSGISSIPTDGTLKQTCEDMIQEYQSYNNSQCWLPVSYPTFSRRSKSSCSPDLGIESDAAVTTTRPLQDTLKITESMTNLLTDEDSDNHHRGIREADSDSPLPLEGGQKHSLEEIEVLKQENEKLKRRLMKTRRALEDTFQHLSASNKNKKNVEKAITKQLMITKSILKKTKTYDEPLDNS